MKSIFDLDEFKPYANRWRGRGQELARRKGYYDGSIYQRVRDGLGWLSPRLYRGIKPLYLPLARAVDVDAGIVPGDWSWPEDAPDAWQVARDVLFDDSNWVTRGVLYVHYGAVFGVSGLRVADLREMGQVQLCPVSPEFFMLVEKGQYDETPGLAFWLEHRQGAEGRVEYAEVITPESIRTFVDGEPEGIDGREPEYPNELGEVPFVEVRHVETGAALGESTYHKAIPLLDEVNEMASFVADVIKKNADPQWIAFGVEPSELERGDNVWFAPHGSDIKPVVPNLDIEGVLAFLQEIRRNVEGALPELAFEELRSKDQIATATIELQLLELVLKIKRVRPNYDQGLIEAMRMAGRAGAGMGLGEIAALDDDALGLDDQRPVLPVSRLDEIRAEEAELALEIQRRLASGEGLTATATGGAE